MENKRVVPVWVSLIFTVLCIGSIGVNLYYIEAAAALSLVLVLAEVFCSIAFVFALTYCWMEYKKNVALFFSLFCWLYALSFAFSIFARIQVAYVLDGTTLSAPNLSFALAIIPFGLSCVFTEAKDLGKRKSLCMSAIILLCAIVDFVMGLNGETATIMIFATKLALALSFFIMVCAKYRDKASRGSK